MKMLDSSDPGGSCFQLGFHQLIASLWAWLFSQFSIDFMVHFGTGGELDEGLLVHAAPELKVFKMQKHFHFLGGGFFL